MLLSQGLTRKNLEDITLNNEAIPKASYQYGKRLLKQPMRFKSL
jgi:hypothetical protein